MKERRRPDVDPKILDIKFHLHIDRELDFDFFGFFWRPLFKRGYQKEQGEAPINEVLASGMLQLAGLTEKEIF